MLSFSDNKQVGNCFGCVCISLAQPYVNYYFVENCFGCVFMLLAQH